eukprot:COSAG02_NODE_4093_length_5795_cov_3.111482_7_plen_88_part_00
MKSQIYTPLHLFVHRLVSHWICSTIDGVLWAPYREPLTDETSNEESLLHPRCVCRESCRNRGNQLKPRLRMNDTIPSTSACVYTAGG